MKPTQSILINGMSDLRPSARTIPIGSELMMAVTPMMIAVHHGQGLPLCLQIDDILTTQVLAQHHPGGCVQWPFFVTHVTETMGEVDTLGAQAYVHLPWRIRDLDVCRKGEERRRTPVLIATVLLILFVPQRAGRHPGAKHAALGHGDGA